MDPSGAESLATTRVLRPGASAGRRRRWPRLVARARAFWRRVLLLLGPIALTALVLWVVGEVDSRATAHEMLVMALASFFALGTTVILAPAVMGGAFHIPLIDVTAQVHLTTWEVATWIIYMNTAAAFFYAYNLDLLEKIPVMGPFLRRARLNAFASLSRHPWIRRLAGVGVVFFVLTPLPGSGQLGGCFVGRVIGLTRRATFLVVTLAGVLVCVLYAMFGVYIKRVLDELEVSPWGRIGVALSFLVVVWFLVKLLRFLGRQPPPPDVADPDHPSPGTKAAATSR